MYRGDLGTVVATDADQAIRQAVSATKECGALGAGWMTSPSLTDSRCRRR